MDDVSLNLLDGKPLLLDSGVSFGVPWPRAPSHALQLSA
jgi:hypothetical protein